MDGHRTAPVIEIAPPLPVPPAPAARLAVLLAMCLGVLIAQVDTSVVNLAIQPIGAAFQASVGSLQWVLDSYNLVYAALLLTGGLLADLYGRRRLFLAGAALMLAASLVCAFAPDIHVLVAARAATGIGAALLLPSSLAIIRVVWPDPAARNRALGIWASCNGLAFAIGPSLGGLLIDRFGWGSVFLLAVPLAVGALALARVAVPESSHPEHRHFDLVGQVLGAVVLGGLAFSAIAAREGGIGWVAALVLAGAALPLFLLAERRRGAAALVPLDLFAQPAFSGVFACTAAMTFGMYGAIFLLPLAWQSSGLLRPDEAGLALLPVSLVFFVVSTQSGRLGERLGLRVMTAGGTALVGLGLLVLSASRGGQDLTVAECGFLLSGIGMGLNTGPLLSIAVGAVPPARSGTASSLINVARMTGATLGVAVLGTVYGAVGLTAAMLAGGLVQLWGAAVAWATVRPRDVR
jgi:MFS transporter, DHA2 family, methylenomycin A resistance protein